MKRIKTVYAFGHFLVDLSCALLVFANASNPMMYLLYNFCAFAVQMPIGLIADMKNICGRAAVTGIVLVILSWIPLPIYVRIILTGLGNACFHVGGGRNALLHNGKYTGLGVFVAPGALGIYLGSAFYQVTWLPALACVLLVLCAFVLLSAKETSYPIRKGKLRISYFLFMFFIVWIRSFVGMCMGNPWKTGFFLALAAVCAASGKALGGLAADRIGWKKAGIVSLATAACLFCFPGTGIAGCVGILLFNMTMPISLRLSAKDLSGMEGFAFGCLTFALFLGYVPAYFGVSISQWTGAVLSMGSAVLIALYKEYDS